MRGFSDNQKIKSEVCAEYFKNYITPARFQGVILNPFAAADIPNTTSATATKNTTEEQDIETCLRIFEYFLSPDFRAHNNTFNINSEMQKLSPQFVGQPRKFQSIIPAHFRPLFKNNSMEWILPSDRPELNTHFIQATLILLVNIATKLNKSNPEESKNIALQYLHAICSTILTNDGAGIICADKKPANHSIPCVEKFRFSITWNAVAKLAYTQNGNSASSLSRVIFPQSDLQKHSLHSLRNFIRMNALPTITNDIKSYLNPIPGDKDLVKGQTEYHQDNKTWRIIDGLLDGSFLKKQDKESWSVASTLNWISNNNKASDIIELLEHAKPEEIQECTVNFDYTKINKKRIRVELAHIAKTEFNDTPLSLLTTVLLIQKHFVENASQEIEQNSKLRRTHYLKALCSLIIAKSCMPNEVDIELMKSVGFYDIIETYLDLYRQLNPVQIVAGEQHIASPEPTQNESVAETQPETIHEELPLHAPQELPPLFILTEQINNTVAAIKSSEEIEKREYNITGPAAIRLHQNIALFITGLNECDTHKTSTALQNAIYLNISAVKGLIIGAATQFDRKKNPELKAILLQAKDELEGKTRY